MKSPGRQQTTVQYMFNGIASNTVELPVVAAAPAIFAADATGRGPGLILNQDSSLNTANNPAASGSVIQILATGGGAIVGGATDGSFATAAGKQTLPVTASIGGMVAIVLYAGPAPGEVSGVMQVNLSVPAGLAAGPQPVVITVNGVASQTGITVAIQ